MARAKSKPVKTKAAFAGIKNTRPAKNGKKKKS